MKSKDQILLEEAYQTVVEGRYIDSYGRFKYPSKYKNRGVTGDPDLDVREADRNAGLEDDFVPSENQMPELSAPVASSTPTEPNQTIDPALLAGKKISFTVWDPGEYVITMDGKPTGGTFSKNEAEQVTTALSSAENNPESLNHPLVQKWVRTAKNLGHIK
jgi:hypothetical protein